MAAVHNMPVSVSLFVAVKVLEMPCGTARGRMLTTLREAAVVVMFVEAIVHITVEMPGTAKPWSCTNENSVIEPGRPVIPVRCAVVRCVVVIAVGTHWRPAVCHAYAHIRVVRSAAEKEQRRHESK